MVLGDASCFSLADFPALAADHSSSPPALLARWFAVHPKGQVAPLMAGLERINDAARQHRSRHRNADPGNDSRRSVASRCSQRARLPPRGAALPRQHGKRVPTGDLDTVSPPSRRLPVPGPEQLPPLQGAGMSIEDAACHHPQRSAPTRTTTSRAAWPAWPLGRPTPGALGGLGARRDVRSTSCRTRSPPACVVDYGTLNPPRSAPHDAFNERPARAHPGRHLPRHRRTDLDLSPSQPRLRPRRRRARGVGLAHGPRARRRFDLEGHRARRSGRRHRRVHHLVDRGVAGRGRRRRRRRARPGRGRLHRRAHALHRPGARALAGGVLHPGVVRDARLRAALDGDDGAPVGPPGAAAHVAVVRAARLPDLHLLGPRAHAAVELSHRLAASFGHRRHRLAFGAHRRARTPWASAGPTTPPPSGAFARRRAPPAGLRIARSSGPASASGCAWTGYPRTSSSCSGSAPPRR
jgi:hypothetical protein